MWTCRDLISSRNNDKTEFILKQYRPGKRSSKSHSNLHFQFRMQRKVTNEERIGTYPCSRWFHYNVTGGPEVMKGSVFFEYLWRFSLF